MTSLTDGRAATRGDLVLVLNCGSSSIKFALFDAGVDPLPRKPAWNGKVQGIGGPSPTYGSRWTSPPPRTTSRISMPNALAKAWSRPS